MIEKCSSNTPKKNNMALKLEQTMEGEWRLGCPVEHHMQGVHSNIKDLNGALKEVQIAPKRTEEFQQIYKKVPKELCKKPI